MGLANEAIRAAAKLTALTGSADARQGQPAAPEPVSSSDPGPSYRARAYYESIATWVQEFQAELDAEHEVGARLVCGGAPILVRLTAISYWNPQLIRFDGLDETGAAVAVIQHVSQISIGLTPVPRRGPAAVRIDFTPRTPTPGPTP